MSEGSVVIKLKPTHYPLVVQRAPGQSAILVQQFEDGEGQALFEVTDDQRGRTYYNNLTTALNDVMRRVSEEMQELPSKEKKGE